jgi:hypothetical protein
VSRFVTPRARRYALTVAVTLVLLTVAGFAGCSRQADPIPFLAETVARPDGKPKPKPEPRPAQPPCRADDLESIWPDAGYTFSDAANESDATGLAVLVRNVGPHTCSLTGYPQVQGIDIDGKPTGSPADHGVYLRAVNLGHQPAVIDPGEPAKIILSTATAGCDGPVRDVRGAEVLLDNGFQFTIKNAWLRGTCQLKVSAWGEVETLKRRFWALEAKLLAPPVVKAGAELVYTVELINVTAASVPLDQCPVFTQVLGIDERFEMDEIDSLYHLTHRLNCSVNAIGPRGAIRYQMKMPIPEGFPPGKTFVYWFVEEGQHPSAMTAVTVTR